MPGIALSIFNKISHIILKELCSHQEFFLGSLTSPVISAISDVSYFFKVIHYSTRS